MHQIVVEQFGLAAGVVNEFTGGADYLEVMVYPLLPNNDELLACAAEALKRPKYDIAHAGYMGRTYLTDLLDLCVWLSPGHRREFGIVLRTALYHERVDQRT